MNYKAVIENIQLEKSDYNYESQALDQSRGLDLLSSDVFSEYIRFLFELIQNADDAKATEVNIEVIDSYIIVSHNGDAFSEADVRSICSVGSGTKKTNTNTTGYKGIGFKSVFGKSNYAAIFSDGFQFRFDETYQHHKYKIMPWQIIPQWTEINDLPKELKKSLKNTWKVSTIIRLDVTEEVLNDLSELLKRSQVLLFLRNLNKISAKGKLETVIEKKEFKSGIIELIKNSTEKSTWLVQRFGGKLEKVIQQQLRDHKNPENRKIPEKIRFGEDYEISFAAKIEKDKIVSLNEKETLIFTYLPTKVKSFAFPFLINSNFLVDTSRENLHEDNAWNQWLMKIAGEKIIDWIASLSNTKHAMEVLHLLPDIGYSNGNKLNAKFFESFIQYSKLKPFVPTKNGYLKTPNEILIDKTGLSDQDFIPTDTIIEYINRETGKSYSVNSFVNPKLESKNKLNTLGSYIFNLENLEDFFIDEIFTKNHQPNQNFALIQYFFEKAIKENTREWNRKLKDIPFIYIKKGILRSPQSVCFPSFNYKNEFGEKTTVIHSDVYLAINQNSKIRDWLEYLGVQEPSDRSYIENEIIGNIDNCITEENYLKVTRFLFNQSRKGKLDESHYNGLQPLKLKTNKNTFENAVGVYLSDCYDPSLKLEKIHEKGSFVSKTYIQDDDLTSEWKTFFVKIGVSQSISNNTSSWLANSVFYLMGDIKYLNLAIETAKLRPNYKGFTIYGFNDIKMLSFIKYATNHQFSTIFWKILLYKFEPTDFNHSPTVNMGYYNGYCVIPDYNKWAFQNLSIFPATDHKCYLAANVFANYDDIKEISGKYMPVFDCDIIISDEWLELIPFKQKLEVEDLLKILGKISKELKKDEDVNNSNRKRIGLIYNKLASELPKYSISKKQQIKNWALTNNLLANNDSFLNPNGLIWINIPNFKLESEQIKTLFIPDNCRVDENFEELLDLFNIQIVDSFIPDIKNKEPNATLKIQLQVILPYLTAIIERKLYRDYSDEYTRLSEILDKTDIFNASEIILSFKNQGETILGPLLYAYLDKNELSIKGKWTSPITLYALLPEILKLFNLIELYDELMLLLQLDENEIKQWFIEQNYDLKYIQNKPEYITSIEKVKSYTSEEDIEQLYDSVDNSDEKSRISISQDAKENIFETLKRKGFNVPDTLNINYTIIKGIKNPSSHPIKIVVKSGKAGKLYFNPSEWLALTESDTHLFVVTRGNIVRNITLNDLSAINDTFNMRFNTQAFAVNTNLKAFANFFRYLPYTHFIFETPESTTDYLQQFGLNDRNPSSKELSSDDKKLLH